VSAGLAQRTRLLLATRNAGKLREFARLLDDLPGVTLGSLADHPASPDVIEDGSTFEANAIKKAREVARATRQLVLSDDSGLEVDALAGRPGVHSARYAGAHGADEANHDKLLAELASVPDGARTARYRVVLALVDPDAPGELVHCESGACEGTITRARRGTGGFGYDPLFVPSGYTQTMAELSAEEKNRISHRALAAAKMRRFLLDHLAARSSHA
jgi:XTP/dITP diphosphohydrolase